MIEVELTVTVNGVTFKYERTEPTVPSSQIGIIIEEAQKIMQNGYSRLYKALESQK